jgi:hemin uptake protein HemP
VGTKADKNKPTEDSVQRHTLDASALFRDRREVAIRFREDVYRLRITRNDKLILTK